MEADFLLIWLIIIFNVVSHISTSLLLCFRIVEKQFRWDYSLARELTSAAAAALECGRYSCMLYCQEPTCVRAGEGGRGPPLIG